MVDSFEQLWARAASRHDGDAAVESRLPSPRTRRALQRTSDDRYLAEMAKAIFRSGFVWRVVDAKWPGFEEAFHGFEPGRVGQLTRGELGDLAQDTRIIRNRRKIEAVRANARFVVETGLEHGGFGRFLADWDSADIVGLWTHLRKHGARLGGDSGPYFLRFVGKDTFVLSRDVVASLVRQGVVTRKPTSQRDLARAQKAFNRWSEESGRPLCQISRVLALGEGEVQLS